MVFSRLKRSLQDLFEDIKSIDRKQELIELHLSKVSLLFKFFQVYSPRPPKEIVALCHYFPARLAVTACTFKWLTAILPSFPFPFRAVKRPLVPEV